MYVCMYVHTHTHIYIYMYTHTHKNIFSVPFFCDSNYGLIMTVKAKHVFISYDYTCKIIFDGAQYVCLYVCMYILLLLCQWALWKYCTKQLPLLLKFIYICGQECVVGLEYCYKLEGLVFKPRWERISFAHPDRYRFPPSHLYDGYWYLFLGIKRPRRGADHPPLYSAL